MQKHKARKFMTAPSRTNGKLSDPSGIIAVDADAAVADDGAPAPTPTLESEEAAALIANCFCFLAASVPGMLRPPEPVVVFSSRNSDDEKRFRAIDPSNT